MVVDGRLVWYKFGRLVDDSSGVGMWVFLEKYDVILVKVVGVLV